MHAASLAKSKRLQRVFKQLQDGKSHTTRDIIIGADVCAVNAIISELRENGHAIECKRTGDVWNYRMTIAPSQAME